MYLDSSIDIDESYLDDVMASDEDMEDDEDDMDMDTDSEDDE